MLRARFPRFRNTPLSVSRIVFLVSIVAWMDMAAAIATGTIGTTHL